MNKITTRAIPQPFPVIPSRLILAVYVGNDRASVSFKM